MENAVTGSDRLSGIDENVCILHGKKNMFLGIDEKYETLSIYVYWLSANRIMVAVCFSYLFLPELSKLFCDEHLVIGVGMNLQTQIHIWSFCY